MSSTRSSRAVQRRDDDARAERGPAPGKRARTEDLAGGHASAAVQRTAASGGGRADDWSMSDGMLAAMGLGAAPVQRKAVQPDGGELAGGGEAAAIADHGVAGASSQLPHAAAIQRSFGRHDVSHIRAQVGGAAAQASAALGAHAYATGDRVAFAEAPDLHTAAHEAAHVVQQAGGVQLKDGLGEAGDRYEQNADAVADAVVAGRSAEDLLDGFASSASTSSSASRTSGATPAQASGGAGDVQKKAVQLVPADYQTVDQLKAMTLAGFDRHAHAQADWAVGPALNDTGAHRAEKEKLRALLALARKDNGLVLGACGRFSVDELVNTAAGGGSSVDLNLSAYSRCASAGRWAGSIHIQQSAASLDLATQWGAAIRKLEAGIGGLIIERVIPQSATYPILAALVAAAGSVDDFIAYYKLAKPVLDATNGAEVESFLAFRGEGGHTKVATYMRSLPEIRNYHRFTKPQLDMLEINKVDAANNRRVPHPLPVCVILQTSLDHNGAFHRKPTMTDVIRRTTHVTLVAEGKATLAELGTELTRFAAFGRGGKVDEVLIAGHGDAKRMELAGEKDLGEDGEGNPMYGNSSNQMFTVDRHLSTQQARTDTDSLITAIRTNLRDDPGARVVIRGCLTASNSIPHVVLSDDPDTAAQQIRDAIAADPSLATAVKTKLGVHQAQVRGANASYANPKLLDGLNGEVGNIDISAPSDPELTNPSKLAYAENGYEPTGVLRATLEAWGTHRVNTIAAVNRRLLAKAGDTSWYETVIRAAFRLISASPDNAPLIAKMIPMVDTLGHLQQRASCTTDALPGKIPDAHVNAVFTELSTAALWTTPAASYLPAVIFQYWVAKNAAKVGDFLTFLDGTDFTTQSASSFFDLALIAPRIATLLAIPVAPATPPRGSFFLALLWMAERGEAAPAEAKAYIRAVCGVGQAFPGTCHVDQVLEGTTERSVLESAGVVAKAGLPPVLDLDLGPPPVREHNVARTGAGNNSHTVDSVTLKCRTWGVRATEVYMLPAGNVIGSIPSGTALNIIGTTRGTQQRSLLPNRQTDFYAVEHDLGGSKTVFVLAEDVKLT